MDKALRVKELHEILNKASEAYYVYDKPQMPYLKFHVIL